MTNSTDESGLLTSAGLPEKGSTLFLTFVCIVSALGGLLFGYDTVVISGTVTAVKAQFSLSDTLEGLFVSSALIGCVIGCAVAGPISDRIGRKKVLIASSLLFVISAAGCGIADSANFLICARWIGGVGVGIASMICPLYISEISLPHLRGRLVTLFQFAITIGICLALFANTALQGISESSSSSDGQGLWHWMVVEEVWRAMFIAEVFPASLFFVLCLTIPESPRWLTKMNRTEEAYQILARVGGRQTAEKEIQEISDAIAQEEGSVAQLFKPGLRKALFVALFLSIVSEMSGVTVILYYGPGILEKAGFTFGDALGGFVPIGIVNMLFTILAIWLIDVSGRRPLLFWGNLGCFLALATIGLLFSQGKTDGAILVVLICFFMACFAFSIGPIKWVVMSEIFPTRIRGRAVAISSLAVWLTDAVYNQLYPMAREVIGEAGMFFVFAAVLIPQFYFVWKVMPETKGLTLEEIEQSWTNK
ncbi:sugar porter family MFS transporter [Bythopirellula polymerisocia]|uniref:Arabinose-proton symporter n=1 Tax=Bythopirellula polymerisocia TaxID=2528003 RepID=A0A5C6CAX9_9BACT|nr:sugar porter family MFS transporter [Bythopirellula polymerisocia]TWU21378.1 Arabinose-proton symporter [Bythopirellula polymerisocia]